MLVGEEVAGASEPALHLVGDEQGLVAGQQVGRGGQESGRTHRHPFALDRFDQESGDVALRELAPQPLEITERDHGVREQGVEAVAELLGPVDGKRTGGQAVERVVAVDDASATGGVAGELQRRLDGLGAAVAEVDPIEVWCRGEQPLGQHARERRRVELGQVGQIGVDDVVNGLPDHGLVSAQREHSEAGEHVEVLAAVGVVQVGARRSGVDLVESDRVQHARQLRVEISLL